MVRDGEAVIFSRRRALVWSVRVIAVTFGIFMGAAFCALVYLAGPTIEGRLFPIIEATHVARSVKYVPGEDDLCWGVHFRKFRSDAPAYFNYRIVFQAKPDPRFPNTNLGKSRVPLAVYRIRDDGSRVYLSSYGFAHHVEDQEWTSEYCADIPRGLEVNTPFTVEGEGYYDTPLHLWLVPQELPTFIVPGIEAIKKEEGGIRGGYTPSDERPSDQR